MSDGHRKSDELGALLRNHGGLDGLACELGQYDAACYTRALTQNQRMNSTTIPATKGIQFWKWILRTVKSLVSQSPTWKRSP